MLNIYERLQMKLVLMFIGFICLSVIGMLLLKIGAMKALDVTPWWHFQNWRLVLGLIYLAFAAFIYILILQILPLNVAQSFAAIQFIAVILASSYLLSEKISTTQWTGIVFITLGIAIVSWSKGY